MDIPSLFGLPIGWNILSYDQCDNKIILNVQATSSACACPVCHNTASRIHSRYARTLSDLPCMEYSLHLKIQVRRFRCLHAECPQKIFTERIPSFVQPWARMTNRLQEIIQSLGLATTGEGGARLAHHFHIQTSSATIIRRIMGLPLPPVESVTALGIDDFS